MKTHKIRLIDSTYGADSAREVLNTLLNDKIKFLNHKIFSMEERFGADTDHMKNRIEELRQEKRDLELLFEEFDGEQIDFEIGCTLVVQVKKAEMA